MTKRPTSRPRSKPVTPGERSWSRCGLSGSRTRRRRGRRLSGCGGRWRPVRARVWPTGQQPFELLGSVSFCRGGKVHAAFRCSGRLVVAGVGDLGVWGQTRRGVRTPTKARPDPTSAFGTMLSAKPVAWLHAGAPIGCRVHERRVACGGVRGSAGRACGDVRLRH